MQASDVDPYRDRGYAPIRFECNADHVTIEGTVPDAIAGSFYFYRIGPNPQFEPRGDYNPLQGDGMVHAFHIRDGRVSYLNRWVRTVRWQHEHAAHRALFGTSGMPGDVDAGVAGVKTDGVANTNLVWHANRLLALEEGNAPIALHERTLATLGPWRFDGALPRNMTAHPKRDVRTGELFIIANFEDPRRGSELGVQTWPMPAGPSCAARA